MTAPTRCADCGHPRADHTLDLEHCRELIAITTEGEAVWCDCRGWQQTPPDRAA